MNRRAFGANQARKVCVGELDHGTEDIDQVKVRIAQVDIDACYDAMYALNYKNSTSTQFEVEVFVKATSLLRVEPTDTLRVKVQKDMRQNTDILLFKKFKKANHSFAFDVISIKFIPTRTQTSNLIHRAVLTIVLRLEDILLQR